MNIERLKARIAERIADLQSANDVLFELDCDTTTERERNNREAEWLRRLVEEDEDFTADAPALREGWQADARTHLGGLCASHGLPEERREYILPASASHGPR